MLVQPQIIAANIREKTIAQWLIKRRVKWLEQAKGIAARGQLGLCHSQKPAAKALAPLLFGGGHALNIGNGQCRFAVSQLHLNFRRKAHGGNFAVLFPQPAVFRLKTVLKIPGNKFAVAVFRKAGRPKFLQSGNIPRLGVPD